MNGITIEWKFANKNNFLTNFLVHMPFSSAIMIDTWANVYKKSAHLHIFVVY